MEELKSRKTGERGMVCKCNCGSVFDINSTEDPAEDGGGGCNCSCKTDPSDSWHDDARDAEP